MTEFLTEVQRVGMFMVQALAKAWPYLLLSIPLAVTVQLSGIGTKLQALAGKKVWLSILVATVFGAFSPLCSCTVIPVIWSLLRSGVPLGPVMAFWLSSPSMDPEIFLLSANQLGWPLAIARLVATFSMSLAAGFISQYLFQKGFFGKGILREQPDTRGFSFRALWKSLIQKLQSKPAADEDNAAAKPVQIVQIPAGLKRATSVRPAVTPAAPVALAPRKTPGQLAKSIARESFKALLFVGKFMVLAYTIEALIVLYLPKEWVLGVLGNTSPFAIPLATALGIPLYTTNLAALGLLGGLLAKGMVPGAVLAFLIAGPTTTLPAMSAVFGIARGKVFAVYLGFVVASALLFGYLYQLIAGGW